MKGYINKPKTVQMINTEQGVAKGGKFYSEPQNCNLVPRLRIRGPILSLHHTPSLNVA
jgi:hypothetical protein